MNEVINKSIKNKSPYKSNMNVLINFTKWLIMMNDFQDYIIYLYYYY